jgi:hypothetical protein
MLAWRLQRHQIDDVRDPYLQFRRMLAQELDRGQGFNVGTSRNRPLTTSACAAVVARPWPILGLPRSALPPVPWSAIAKGCLPATTTLRNYGYAAVIRNGGGSWRPA